MPKTTDQLMESETILRYDEFSENASLWTLSVATKRTWESFGFKLSGDKFNGWSGEIPIDRITYKPLKGSK